MTDNSFFESFMAPRPGRPQVFDQNVLDDRKVSDDPGVFDLFLRDEGLELLSAYRSIQSDSIRKSLLDLIVMIAAEEGIKRHAP